MSEPFMPSNDSDYAGRRWMLGRAFLSQNVAIGCSFGAFGVTVLPLQQRFDAGSGAISFALGLVVLAMGLLGPAVAALARRFGLRLTMALGALLSGIGYAALAFAPDMTMVLLVYGLLIGPGVALFGSLASSLLASGWYPEARGRAVGTANMPVLLAIAPLIGIALIDDHGLPTFYLSLAALHLALLPVLMGVRDAPSTQVANLETQATGAIGIRALLSRPAFWAMVVGGGALNATGITGVGHMVSIAVERGISAEQAALLVSVMGAASVIGSLAAGWLCDRIGGGWALATVASGFAIGWALIVNFTWLPIMAPAMLLVGACGAGVFPSVNVLSARLFGLASLGRAVGLFGMLTLPLTFLLPPAAGLLRDMSGNYLGVMLSIIAVCATVAAIFLMVGRTERRIAIA